MTTHHESPFIHADQLPQLSLDIENLLVARNLRGMKQVQPALTAGYLLRSAQLITSVLRTKANPEQPPIVLIGTGFPVADTFETDGPVGAIALYQSLTELGFNVFLVCANPLQQVLKLQYQTLSLPEPSATQQQVNEQIGALLDSYQPDLIISIERPGKAADGKYYNMRKEDISSHCGRFDDLMSLCHCPTLAIGDGGNEIGMGNIQTDIAKLDIIPSVTQATELIIADVSNWGALGLIALVDAITGSHTLEKINALDTLKFLSQHGSVDGVTRENTLTEDGLEADQGLVLQQQILHTFSTVRHTKGDQHES